MHKNIYRMVGPRELRFDQMPEFIWIAKVDDPNSAKLAPADKFSEMIGSGIRLSSVTVGITEDPTVNSLAVGHGSTTNIVVL